MTQESVSVSPVGLAAVYPDFSVSEACVDCHKDSPRTDIELSDVIGGVVIRIPME